MKKAIKYSFVFTFAFLILALTLFFLMRISMRDSQAKRLEEEGVEVLGGKVNLEKYQWKEYK